MGKRGRPNITLRDKIIRKIARLEKEIQELRIKLETKLEGDEPAKVEAVEVPVVESPKIEESVK